MHIIDSHTHIYAEEFDDDLDEMIIRARSAGVAHMVLPAIDRSSYERMMLTQARYPSYLSVAIGLHPTSVGPTFREELSFVEDRLADGGYVAIGEIGLDYYWDVTYRWEQIEAFEHQLRLADREALPVIVHTREAFADVFASLRRTAPQMRGVFHSFTGTEAELDEALSFSGFMIGVNGVVTFKNSRLRDYLGRLPLERLLIETDAPYLSPVPHRGKRNEPAYLRYTLEHLAPIWGLSPDELAEVTTANAQRLFALKL